MADKITKVTGSKGFFGTLAESLKKVVSGFAMFFLAFPLLLWNECRSVTTAKSLDEGAGLVVEVSADAIDAANQSKLVHITGEAKTNETLKDPQLSVAMKGLRLRRSVEMYQWLEREEKKTKDDKEYTTWYYEKGWSSNLVDYTDFEEIEGHVNPSSMPYESETWQVAGATVGAWNMSADQIAKVSNFQKLTITDDAAKAAGRNAQAYNGDLYIGPNPSSPVVGDVRIEYEVVPEGPVSLIGQQVSSTMQAYQTQAGDALLLVQTGTHNSAAMFEKAHSDNVMMTWLIRFIGFFMMFMGLSLIFGPVKVIADKVPFIGNALEFGVALVAFLLAAFLSLMTIAVSWIVVRPLVGIGLMILAIGSVVGLVMLVRKGKAKKEAAAAA
jgi:hypothetical protein